MPIPFLIIGAVIAGLALLGGTYLIVHEVEEIVDSPMGGALLLGIAAIVGIKLLK